MASVRQVQITFDCAEPEQVARFWCEVLGYVVPPPPEGFATRDDYDRSLPPEQRDAAFACIDPTGVGPRLFFQRVPEGKVARTDCIWTYGSAPGSRVQSAWPPSRLNVHDSSLSAQGVRLLPADDENESCLVMQDIEGNEFCLD